MKDELESTFNVERPWVLIADDNAKMRSSLAELLDSVFDVIAVVENGKELIEAAVLLRPDVIVSGITMARMDGLEARDKLIAEEHAIPFVFVTGLGREVTFLLPNEFSTDEEPALGFVYKHDMPHHLLQAVEAVLLGRHYVSPHYRK